MRAQEQKSTKECPLKRCPNGGRKRPPCGLSLKELNRLVHSFKSQGLVCSDAQDKTTSTEISAALVIQGVAIWTKKLHSAMRRLGIQGQKGRYTMSYPVALREELIPSLKKITAGTYKAAQAMALALPAQLEEAKE